MQNISNLIASSVHHGERRLSGAFAAGAFVVIVVLGAAGAAVWVGSSLSHASAAPAPFTVADESYQ